jgi:predicted PurR-regulated permease PerM
MPDIERRASASRPMVIIPLAALLLFILYLAILVFRPFFLDFVVAAALALFLNPLQRRLELLLGNRRALAAAALATLTALVILLPVLTFVMLLGNQAAGFFAWLAPHLEPDALQRLWRQTLPERYPWMHNWVRLGETELMPLVADALMRFAAGINALIQRLVTGLGSALFDLFLFLMMLFFLLRDRQRLREELKHISPLSDAQEELLFSHLGKTVKAVVQAMALVPLSQGVLALLGFWVFGVPSAELWAVMVIFAAMIPLLGSPLAWVPACVYLFTVGDTWRGVGLLAYCILVISTIDNFLKPILLKGTAQIHPVLGFLSIVGGLIAFGPLGFLVGPVVLSLVLSGIQIYRMDILRRRPDQAA